MKIVFYEQDQKVSPNLFSDRAEELAKKLASDNKHQAKVNKRTQVRKFYDEVLRLENVSNSRPDQWEAILPQIHMLVAKAAYARGRELVSDEFLEFVKSSVQQIQSSGDLSLFSGFFEAMMGFYRLHGPKN